MTTFDLGAVHAFVAFGITKLADDDETGQKEPAAEPDEKPAVKQKPGGPMGAIKGVGGTLAANTGAVLGLSASMTKDVPNTAGRAKAIGKGMGTDTKVKVEKKPNVAHFDPYNTKKVHVSKGTEDGIIAHEFGHARVDQEIRKLPVGVQALIEAPSLASRLYMNLPIAGVHGALPLGMAAWAGAQEEPTWKPGLIGAGLAAPTLMSEASASLLGAKYLIQRDGLAQGLRGSLPMLPAFATYASLGLAPLGITAARKYMRRREQNAQPPAEAPVEQ